MMWFTLKFFTDAACSVGFKCYFHGQWFSGKWPQSFLKLDSSSALYEIQPPVACGGGSGSTNALKFSATMKQLYASLIKAAHSVLQSVAQNSKITIHHVLFNANVIADSLSHLIHLVLKPSKAGGTCTLTISLIFSSVLLNLCVTI